MPMEIVPLGGDIIVELIIRSNTGVHKIHRIISEEKLVESTLKPKVLVGMEVGIMTDILIGKLFQPEEE
jgi:hypothetical protein